MSSNTSHTLCIVSFRTPNESNIPCACIAYSALTNRMSSSPPIESIKLRTASLSTGWRWFSPPYWSGNANAILGETPDGRIFPLTFRPVWLLNRSRSSSSSCWIKFDQSHWTSSLTSSSINMTQTWERIIERTSGLDLMHCIYLHQPAKIFWHYHPIVNEAGATPVQ